VPLDVSWLHALLRAERDSAMATRHRRPTDADSPLRRIVRVSLSTSTLLLPAVLLHAPFRPSAAVTRELDLGASALHLAAALPPRTFWISGMIFVEVKPKL